MCGKYFVMHFVLGRTSFLVGLHHFYAKNVGFETSDFSPLILGVLDGVNCNTHTTNEVKGPDCDRTGTHTT